MRKTKLYKKFLAVNGDSICQGAGMSGGYAKIIAERNKMKCQNIGIGGGTISAETYYKKEGDADPKPRHWICRTVAEMDETADYAIVEGGVNDASLDVPVTLGAISVGYDAPLDDTTFYGAFESMLKQLTKRFAGKKIGYIAVHKMTPGFSTDDKPEESYYYAAKRCCEKWGVPFCDLNVACPAFAFFEENGDPVLYEMRKTYTRKGDGWHPNEAGYLKYYCDKIEAWLLSL